MILLRALLAAIGFLTRIPVPSSRLTPRLLGLSVGFFPAVGMLLGGVLALLSWALSAHLASAPPLLSAVAVVSVHTLLTVGLHLDGLADVADGLGGGRGSSERVLDIMRDSRIGSFGAVALILVLMTKVIAMRSALSHAQSVALLVAFPAVARFGCVLLIIMFPYARQEGLGRDFHVHSSWRQLLIAAATTAVPLTLSPGDALVAAAAAIACAMLVGVSLYRRLRGLTGDVYGAAIEVAEVAFLVVVVAVRA